MPNTVTPERSVSKHHPMIKYNKKLREALNSGMSIALNGIRTLFYDPRPITEISERVKKEGES